MTRQPVVSLESPYPANRIHYFTEDYQVVDTTYNRLNLMLQQGKLNGIERGRLLLNSGLDAFDMEVACLTRIDDNCITIAYSTDSRLESTQFHLYQTLCQFTLEHNNVLAVHNLRDSEWYEFSMIENLQFSAYIGTPVYTEGKLYGTLFFASYEPRLYKFTNRDEAFIKVVASSFRSIIAQ